MAERPSAGRARERLHFQHRIVEPDEYGNDKTVWETVFTTAAELIPLRGTETVMASRLTGVQPFIVRIRSCEASRAVTPDWRAVDARNAARVLNIRTVTNPDQKNAWLDLLVDNGVAT
ncbi:head-tail adaptor protein [Rhizobium sp. CC1099]|uniref:head-tail adaptor protein n=1 Tax=Rhizobium sp. CC1099 TaxID=3039160 RepID=UPI0024B0A4C9|nr:head-tail adaptor protein [Rhizobium sp. CC1099]WFU88985.1 head-tail adaptor protein [Rhizobium sp. CC1099]